MTTFSRALASVSILLVMVVMAAGCAGAGDGTPAPTPVPSPAPVPQPLPTPTPAPTSVLTVGGSGRYATIQEAINSARSGDTIQVAQGTYLENITIKTSKTFTLQGGWDLKFISRSDNSSLTVIDGKGSGSVIQIQAGLGVAIELTIEGFTIRNGNAERGGGIHVGCSGTGSHVSLTLNNNAITGNTATASGGGICASAAQKGSTILLNVVNNSIAGNASNNRGGGIFIECNAGAVVSTLTNNAIRGNTANNEGGGIRVNSGGGGSAVVTLTKNIITANAVTQLVKGEGGWDGGGIAAFASRSGATALTLTNNVITENEAGWGGGIFGYAWGPDARTTFMLNNNIIAKNRAQYGAGIYCCSGKTCPVSEPGGSVTWTLANNTVTGNTASKDFGGIFFYSGSTYGDGGSINLSARNDIVWGNRDSRESRQINLVVQPEKSGVATAIILHSDVGSVVTGGAGAYTLDSTINKDPLFVDPANGVFLLKEGSPCIDSGDPGSAYNDGKRPPAKGTQRNDMGAYGGPNNDDWPEEATLSR